MNQDRDYSKCDTPTKEVQNCSTCGFTCTSDMHYVGCYGEPFHKFWIPQPSKEIRDIVNNIINPCGEELVVEDKVNHPSHYADGKIECIDAMEVVTEGLNGFEGALTGNVLKYTWRWKKKNGIEDLRKAKWYLERLIAYLEGGAE